MTRCHIIQRLDKGTSGAMVVPTTAKAASIIGGKLRTRDFEKQYIGFCKGIPRGSKGPRYSGSLMTALEFDFEEKR